MKSAVIEVGLVILAQALGLFDDESLRVTSVVSDPEYETVFVFVEGAALPAECVEGCKLVRITMVVQSHGKQLISKVEKYEVENDEARSSANARIARILNRPVAVAL